MILVIGEGGQLSESLREIVGGDAKFVGYPEIDLAQAGVCRQLIMDLKPETVFNAAAYTQVDKAESEVKLCEMINAAAPLEMAHACSEVGSKFIHYSTDYVYSGQGVEPWREGDPLSPVNRYGNSKALGEKAILDIDDPEFRFAILRTSWIYSPIGKNFVLTMLKLGAEREELSVVSDQVGAPTYAPHLAFASMTVAKSLNAQTSGVYNCAASGFTTWFDFAQAIFSQARDAGFDLKVRDVKPVKTSEYPTPAKRPLNSRLNQDKLLGRFGVKLPHWSHGLAECLEKIKGAT